jgi:hypothetical protein
MPSPSTARLTLSYPRNRSCPHQKNRKSPTAAGTANLGLFSSARFRHARSYPAWPSFALVMEALWFLQPRCCRKAISHCALIRQKQSVIIHDPTVGGVRPLNPHEIKTRDLPSALTTSPPSSSRRRYRLRPLLLLERQEECWIRTPTEIATQQRKRQQRKKEEAFPQLKNAARSAPFREHHPR